MMVDTIEKPGDNCTGETEVTGIEELFELAATGKGNLTEAAGTGREVRKGDSSEACEAGWEDTETEETGREN